LALGILELIARPELEHLVLVVGRYRPLGFHARDQDRLGQRVLIA
jgi:hypothetical protein